MLRSIIFLIAILTVTTLSAFCEAIDYRDTYVLIIGATKWRDRDIPSFKPEQRKDLSFANALFARGVKGENLTLLLETGTTLTSIRTELEKNSLQSQGRARR